MKIEKSHDRFRALFDSSSDGLLILDMQGNFIDINRTAYERLGYSKAEMLAMKLTELDTPDFAPRIPEQIEEIKKYGMAVFETAHYRKDGSIMPVEINTKIIDLDGEKFFFSAVRDITERKQAEEELQLTQFVSDHAPDCIVWVDEQARICYVNEAECREHGYTKEELLTMSIPDIDPDFLADAWPAHWQELKQKGTLTFETRHRRKDGSIFLIEVSANFVRFGDKELNIAFTRNITERKQAEEGIRQMAYHDYLTGLPNRALFYDRLQQALAHAHRNRKLIALLILDLDYFKPINDELGHEGGDQALIETGKRLRQCVRETDTVARIGGDEFAIILVDVASEEAACKMAEKVIAAIRQPLSLKTSQYTLSASVGICLAPSDDGDMESLVSKADSAMYQAKDSGKNCYRVGNQTLSLLNR